MKLHYSKSDYVYVEEYYVNHNINNTIKKR